MTIPNNLIQKLKSVEIDAYNDSQLNELCQHVINSFLDDSKNVDSDKFSNELVFVVGTIIIRAASTNTDPSTLKELLFAPNGQEHRVGTALLNAYTERFNELVDGPLKTIGWKYPQIVDIDYKLCGVMESDSETGIKEPLAELTITSLATGATKTEDFSFVCTKQQLQDIQWSIKEAHNLLLKMTQ